MTNYSAKKFFMVFAATLCVLAVGMAGTAAAKSIYLIANHHTAQFDAWDQNPDGTVVAQATYDLSSATDPAGVAIWEDPNSADAVLFVTSEFSLAGVELVDATTMKSMGTATADSTDFAGIDIDDDNLVVYTVKRYTPYLYVYDWNPVAKILSPRMGSPFTLPGCTGAFGIALDETTGILWVADAAGNGARAYDVTSLTEDTTKSFTPSHRPIDIAVDRNRGIVYTVSMNIGAWSPGGSLLLSKYDLATGTETLGTLSCQGVGVAVDEITGYVYVTISPYCGNSSYGQVQVWDTSTSPWTQVDAKTVTGSPAGITIANTSYNPLNLAKNDIIQGVGVAVGDNFTYEITCDNVDNSTLDATDVTILDTLPTELDFFSATDGGVYDSSTHTVFWNIGTIPAGQPEPVIDLVVTVNQNAVPGTTIYNYCTINYTFAGQDNQTTVTDQDPDDSNDEPGTDIIEAIAELYPCPDEYRWGDPAPGYSYNNMPIFESWMEAHFVNSGIGDAYNVTATISYAPVNVTIVDGNVALGDIPAGGSAWSTGDTFTLEVDMSNPQNPNEGIKWRVEYDDTAGVHHVVENVPEF